MTRAVEWLERNGTFLCQRRDCPREKKPDCSLCGMPELHKDTAAVMKLYQRCKTLRALPRPGGVFDQDEETMTLFDVIETAVENVRREKQDTQESEFKRMQMMRGTGA